jgi:hypothetical protein
MFEGQRSNEGFIERPDNSLIDLGARCVNFGRLELRRYECQHPIETAQNAAAQNIPSCKIFHRADFSAAKIKSRGEARVR